MTTSVYKQPNKPANQVVSDSNIRR